MRLFTSGETGNISDRYTLAAVVLAGLASRFEWEELRAVVVGMALLVLLVLPLVYPL